MKKCNLSSVPDGNWTRKLLTMLLLFVFMAGSVFAQTKTLSGTVTGEDGAPIPGVTVMVKGTSVGTVTDLDGKYNLTGVPADAETLVVSYIGMKTQEIEIGNQTVINATLAPDVVGVDEVVVVGYGTQQKKSLTGSVASVSADELQAVPTANAASRLQGRVAGVTITNDNSPGGDATVRIRGYGTINNNDPLFVIDGVPTTGGLSRINPNDIESMTVLKDASSAAIYGVRAANGVVIITTKRGKAGKPKVSFDARYGVQRTTNKLDLLNTQEYGDLVWMVAANDSYLTGTTVTPNHPQYGAGATPQIPDYVIPTFAFEGAPNTDPSTYNNDDTAGPLNLITRANKQGTDWYDEIFDPAPIQEYNLGVSGGTDKATYAISMGYLNQEGVVIHTGFERYSMRSNMDAQVTDWLKIGQTLGVGYTKRTGSYGTNNDEGNAVSQAYRMQPIIPVYDIMGNFAGTKAAGTGNGANPVANLTRDKDDWGTDLRVLANAYMEVKLMKDFTFKTLGGVDLNNGRSKNYTIRNIEFAEAIATNSLSEYHGYTLQWNWANTLNYNKTINNTHYINVLLGSEAVSNKYEEFTAGRSKFFSDDVDYRYLNAGEGDQTNGGFANDWKTFSYFGRLNYDYMHKYLLEAVVRRDASSRFGAANRWGTFPAFSAGWRISEEGFMGDVPWLDDLKLRAGWGQNGNDQIGNYDTYAIYSANRITSYYSISGDNTSTSAGFNASSLANPDVKWETTTTTDIGVDMTVLDNRLEINLDWYNKKTADMLYPVALPATYGNASRPNVNIGDMKNTGIDAMITYHGKVGKDFLFNIRANASHYKNEVIKLNDNAGEVLWGATLRQRTYTRSEAGQPISSFYGYEVVGIFNSWDEANSWPAFGDYNKPGRFKYKDQNGDGKIDPDNDRTYIGSPHPDLTYGLNLDMTYKNWDMTMFFQGSLGNDVINYVNRWIDFNNFAGNRSKKRLYESWTADRYAAGDKISLPIAESNDEASQDPNSFFVEDGSYFRMKDFQLGYTLPSRIANRWGIDRLRVYFQATNLFTVTKYSGLDPEIRDTSDQADQRLGVDEGIYPTAQTFMFGVNLNL